MAMEAVRQVHVEDGALLIASFRLRNVAINSILRVPDNEFGIETALNLMQVNIGITGEKSVWLQFSIASASPESTTWTEHCTSSISIDTQAAGLHQAQKLYIDPCSRSLAIRRGYKKFKETGLAYGPAFQGLSHLKVYHGSNTVSASVTLVPQKTGINTNQSLYAIIQLL